MPKIKVPADLSAAYRTCEAITRREGSNFHWGFRFLSKPERDALYALYAFARRTDDIVDEPGTGDIVQWRASLEAALAGSSDDPILAAIADAARKFEMPTDELFLLIEGCGEDLTPRRFRTFEETLAYCRKVAVTVGLSMLAIFRSNSPAARAGMIAIGNAFQMTNILRDIAEDLRRERIYLPVPEKLEGDFRRGRTTPELLEFMRTMTDHAARFYGDARPLYENLDPAPARTMRAMGKIYEAILDQIRRQDYDVWVRRPSVSKWRKMSIMTATLLNR